jgi:hypothetical protein
LANLGTYLGFKNAYFLYKLRGAKGAMAHDPADMEAWWGMLDEILKFFNMQNIVPED